mmetsp:Transcript_31741/g.67190  ORF Transcript_31741/g.67190 Transcript_31741/m.67190 type:complete len:277 (+) Transcript_31741:28-858(+)
MVSEGRHEVEASRKRLEAAKAQGTTASKAMEAAKEMITDANATMETAEKMLELAKNIMATAKKNEAAAQLQVDLSKKEIDEAKKSLEDAERRWEVIDISGGDDGDEEPTRKKRKSSNRTRHQERNTINDGDVPSSESSSSSDIAMVRVQTNDSGSALAPNRQDSISRNITPRTAVQKIVVERCGTQGANGTYLLSGQSNGKPTYSKYGRFGPCFGRFKMHAPFRGTWLITFLTGQNRGYTMYSTFGGSDSDLPPENSIQWQLYGHGKLPLPELKWN